MHLSKTARIQPFLFCMALILTAYASPVSAEISAAVKLGNMQVDIPAASEPDSLALMLSYGIDNMFADFSIAAEVSTAFDQGRTPAGEHIDVQTRGLYLMYEGTGTIFVNIRAGFAQDKITVGNSVTRDSGFSRGMGLGLVIGRTRWMLDTSFIHGRTTFIGLSIEYD